MTFDIKEEISRRASFAWISGFSYLSVRLSVCLSPSRPTFLIRRGFIILGAAMATPVISVGCVALVSPVAEHFISGRLAAKQTSLRRCRHQSFIWRRYG